MKKFLPALIAVVALSGCARGFNHPSVHPEDLLTATERSELKLPAESVLTRSTKEDAAYVTALPPSTIKAIHSFLSSANTPAVIFAARPIGNYLLLWIGFPEIMDGGIDLIWSTKENKPVGTFLGGYRG